MSLSEGKIVSETDGHARKFVSIQFADVNQFVREQAISQLRKFFLPRADIADKSGVLTKLENQLWNPPAEAHGEIIQGAFTRQQRKGARRLGFDVKIKREPSLG